MTPSDVVGRRVKAARRRQELTVAELAQRCIDAGAFELTEQALYNLEGGRRDKQGRRRRAVTVDELLILAYVLSVAPVHLLVPIDDNDQPYPVVPKSQVRVGRVRQWVRGNWPMAGADERTYYSVEVPARELPHPPLKGQAATNQEVLEYEAAMTRGEVKLGDLRVEPSDEGA
jgi:transcriptional regulator with XRE-family HTH domain